MFPTTTSTGGFYCFYSKCYLFVIGFSGSKSSPIRFIIDDDPLNSELMDKILSKLNHNITTANNAKDALKEIRSSKFDLVLLDIIMPDVNGIELLQKIKKNNDYYETPIIMLSALDDADGDSFWYVYKC